MYAGREIGGYLADLSNLASIGAGPMGSLVGDQQSNVPLHAATVTSFPSPL